MIQRLVGLQGDIRSLLRKHGMLTKSWLMLAHPLRRCAKISSASHVCWVSNSFQILLQIMLILISRMLKDLCVCRRDTIHTTSKTIDSPCIKMLKGWDIFNVVNLKKLIYIKLYSLLILTENTKKSKNNFKAPKKSEIVVFPGRILPCKQNKSAIYLALYITYSHVSDGNIRAVAANWCLIVRTREYIPAALIVYPTLGRCHQHVAQCFENIQSSFRYTNSLFGLLLVS